MADARRLKRMSGAAYAVRALRGRRRSEANDECKIGAAADNDGDDDAPCWCLGWSRARLTGSRNGDLPRWPALKVGCPWRRTLCSNRVLVYYYLP